MMLWFSSATWTCRVSNRSAGLISNRFPGVYRRHFDQNSVEFEVFETANFNINEEACDDRPHPTPVTVTSNTYQFILVYCQMFLLIHFEIQKLRFIITTNTRTRPEKIPRDFTNFQKISSICRRKNNSSRFLGFSGVLDTIT